MRTMLNILKKRKYGISEDILNIFEQIIQKYYVPNRGSNEGDNKFMEAINEHLTLEQRIRLWEDHGGCKGTGHDKERKSFALEHEGKHLSERIKLYLIKTYGKNTRNIVLNEESNTLTVIFACDECYRHTLEGKLTAPFTLYYEACAGGRLYNLQTALGIKLRIKSIDISPSGVNIENPGVFTFEIMEYSINTR